MSVAAFMLGCCLLEAIHDGAKAACRKIHNRRNNKRWKALKLNNLPVTY